MLRPHELCKWLQKTNRTDFTSLNPESPLIRQKTIREKSNMHSSMVMAKFQVHPDEEIRARNFERRTKNIRRIVWPLKQGVSSKISGRIAQIKYYSQKINSRRTNTVPSKLECSPTPYSKKSSQNPPVLIISELKLHSSAIAAQREANSNQCLDDIQIHINDSPQSRHKLNKAKLSNRKQTIQQIISTTQEISELIPTTNTSHLKIHNIKTERNQSLYNSVRKTAINKRRGSITKQANEHKIIKLNYIKPFKPPTNVTAKSFVVYRLGNHNVLPRVLISHNSKNRQQIASLTKIMTAILTIEICKFASIDKYAQVVTISSFEAGITGTTASLRQGEVYTIEQLLFGLMLPSGNDASVALAAWAGSKLLEHLPQSRLYTFNNYRSEIQKEQTIIERRERGYRRFIEEMNSKARQLKMKKTVYMNSHGLSNPQSKSCAYDVAILCEYCMNNETFRSIVKCQKYSGYIQTTHYSLKSQSSSEVPKKLANNQITWSQCSFTHKRPRLEGSIPKKIKVQWTNTHQLIKKHPEDYLGIKTGFTYTAGPCLASCVRIDGLQYIIVVLGCESASMRFRDTEVLRKWTKEQLQFEKQKLYELQKGKRRSILNVKPRNVKS